MNIQMKILVVEDEINVASFLKKGLSEEKFDVSIALDGDTGWQMLQQNSFDLAILDVMLPNKNGLELLKLLRSKFENLPVILLTALGTTDNIISGLNNGADDYISKPFKFEELLARIHALIRRSQKHPQDKTPKHHYSLADLEINDESKVVKRAGQPIDLTATEYRLLLYLIKNKDRVLSRNQILSSVWSIDFDLSTNIVDVYINYIRNKIQKEGLVPLIKTVSGMGYKLTDTE